MSHQQVRLLGDIATVSNLMIEQGTFTYKMREGFICYIVAAPILTQAMVLSKGELLFVGLQTSVWVGDAGCLLTR